MEEKPVSIHARDLCGIVLRGTIYFPEGLDAAVLGSLEDGCYDPKNYTPMYDNILNASFGVNSSRMNGLHLGLHLELVSGYHFSLARIEDIQRFMDETRAETMDDLVDKQVYALVNKNIDDVVAISPIIHYQVGEGFKIDYEKGIISGPIDRVVTHRGTGSLLR